MKGITFQKSLEIQIVTQGESWKQGDPFEGVMKVKNRGASAVSLEEFHVHLAYGVDKKVKSKDASAFTILETADLNVSGVLDANAETPELKWVLNAEAQTALITDKTGSLYLLYGFGSDLSAFGSLLLTVHPRLHFEELSEVLEASHRFVRKLVKNSKDGVIEMKFVPPSGREHASIDHLMLGLKLTPDHHIDATFCFTLKKLDAAAGGGIKKVKKAVHRDFSPSEFIQTFTQRLDKDKVEHVLSEVFQEAKGN